MYIKIIKLIFKYFLFKIYIMPEINRIKIYTDGACQNNGKLNAKCGVGIYFGKDDTRNLSKALKGPLQTNNIAELTAILYCLKILLKTEKNIDDNMFIIFSDSKYSIDCITKYIVVWLKNNWQTATKKPVKNRTIIESIYNMMSLFKNLEFKYIKAHTKNMDEDSIGNRNADLLATNSLRE